MDYAGLTKLLIRIAGVLSIANGIGTLPLLVYTGIFSLALIPAMALPLLIGCLLFFCAGRITNRVFDAPVATVARPEVSKVEGAALFVLGCYLLALAIVDAIYNSAKLLLPWWLSPALNPSLAIPEYALLFRTIAQFAIAFTLIFGFRGIVALKDRLLGPTTD